MKNNNNLYLKLILIVNLISFINLNAQCQIEKNLDTFEYSENNVYYKDINNILNPFEGTFLNSNSGFVLRISLLKKLSSTQPNVSYCEDMLIGAFEFISGAIQLNTLSTLNTFYEDGTRYTIYANSIYTGKTRGCDECGDDEKWLIGTIKDPVSGSVDELFIRKIMHSGQEAIKIFIRHSLGFRLATDPIPPPITYPVNQDIILIKQ